MKGKRKKRVEQLWHSHHFIHHSLQLISFFLPLLLLPLSLYFPHSRLTPHPSSWSLLYPILLLLSSLLLHLLRTLFLSHPHTNLSLSAVLSMFVFVPSPFFLSRCPSIKPQKSQCTSEELASQKELTPSHFSF